MNDLEIEFSDYLATRDDAVTTARQAASDAAATRKSHIANTMDALFSDLEQQDDPSDPDEDPNDILRDIFN